MVTVVNEGEPNLPDNTGMLVLPKVTSKVWSPSRSSSSLIVMLIQDGETVPT